MSGYTKDENSLASGIPNRTISPETGSFGNATKTNAGDTSEGTNQDHEARPAPAAGLDSPALAPDDLGERRSFASGSVGTADIAFPENDIESVAQQIADGGDHFDRDKRLNDDEETDAERRRRLDQRP